MAPLRRKKDTHLPKRVYIDKGRKRKDGSYPPPRYYLKTKDNKELFLGNNFAEAMAEWVKVIDKPLNIYSMNDLFDRYMLEIAPKKSKGTYKNNLREIKNLRDVFGEMNPESITPVHVYAYLDKRGVEAKVSANREKALLSHVFTKAIRWGVLRSNPCFGVKRLTEKPRDRYVEDWEFDAVYEIASPLIKCLMVLSYLMSRRRVELKNIRLDDLKEDGIYINIAKGNKKLIVAWSIKLKSAVDELLSIRKKIKSIYLFSNQKGQPYTDDGLSCLWQKTIVKAVKSGVIKERFTFHDIRAKGATDAKDKRHANELLGHTTMAMTERVYIRKPTLVRPVK